MKSKRCTKCNIKKSLDQFGETKATVDRVDTQCKECRNLYRREYYHSSSPEYKKKLRVKAAIWQINKRHSNNDYRLKCNARTIELNRKRYREDPKFRQACIDTGKESVLKNKFNMTRDDYYMILKNQNNSCAICKTKDPGRHNKFFTIDHNHKTGKVRGLLCHTCNVGLGNFKDNLNIVVEAVNYLKKEIKNG